MNSRRKFIKNLTAVGATVPLVANIEAKRVEDNKWEPYKFYGREKTNLNMVDWIKTIQDKGCGEILITSIDNEGMESGFDIDLINHIYNEIKKPLIISGGCGGLNHIKEVKEKFNNSSVAIASVLHYKKLKISKIKELF